MTELSREREELKGKLDRRITKRNFVILENMLNCSGKVYFKKTEQYIRNKSSNNREEMEQARKCMEEDIKNILVIFNKKGLISVKRDLMLPEGSENSERRIIEMDNKAILYTFCKAIQLDNIPGNKEVLTPGYGSIYIGPFIKEFYGIDYTNLLKSKYIDEAESENGKLDFNERVNTNRIFEKGKTVLLLDDNVGTGQTMEETKKKLNEYDVANVLTGAIQYNWFNYYRISVGEKKLDKYGDKIKRFNVEDFDIVSPINYAGHKLYKIAIDRLLSSGQDYIDYLKSKSYKIEGYNDIIGAVERGMQYSEMSGLELSKKYNYKKRKEREIKPLTEEYESKNEQLTVSGQVSLDKIIETLKDITEDKITFLEKER